jgi:HEAT repeat protein
MTAEPIIKQQLSAGPRTAKQLVEACARQEVKRSTVFYWLNKLKKNGTIRKVGMEYELLKLEAADPAEITFLIAKITDKNELVRKAAIEDLATLCMERRIPEYKNFLASTRDLLKSSPYPELRSAALRYLRFITVNSKRTKDAEVLEELVKFKEPLERLVLNKKMDQALRNEATTVLNVLLNENETPRLMKLLEQILEETTKTPKGQVQPFQIVGLKLWQSILKRTSSQTAINELRERLYKLLEHENGRVREIGFYLLDKLRMKEYGFEPLM